VIALACLAIGWILTSITLAEWSALAVALVVATMLFVFRKPRGPI
jgi:hypothetical protein